MANVQKFGNNPTNGMCKKLLKSVKVIQDLISGVFF